MRSLTQHFLIGIALTAVASGGQIPANVRNDLKAGLDDKRQQAVKDAARLGQADAVPLLLPVAASDRDGRVRDTAFDQLSRIKGDDAVKVTISKGLESRNAKVRAIAAELLGSMRASAATADLVKALADRDLLVRRRAAEALGYLKEAAALESLAQLVDEAKDPALRSIAVESVSRIGGDDARACLERWSREGGGEVRLQALHSLRYHDRTKATNALVLALDAIGEGDNVEIRPLLVQAIEDARVLRRKELVPPLIDLLEYPRGRIRQMSFAALRDVTGMDLPDVAENWREWWEHYGDTFDVPEKRELNVQPGASRSHVRFYGAPIFSDRMVFVIDFSGSMRDPGPDGRVKIDVAREALRETLEAMPETAEFNLITFSDEARAWQKYMVPVEKKNVEDALRFLKASAPRGYTNVHDALELALQIQGVDTIVLLSDGAPSTGRHEYYSRIRASIGRQNRLKKVAITTVALGVGENSRSFLGGLAKDTGGNYIEP